MTRPDLLPVDLVVVELQGELHERVRVELPLSNERLPEVGDHPDVKLDVLLGSGEREAGRRDRVGHAIVDPEREFARCAERANRHRALCEHDST